MSQIAIADIVVIIIYMLCLVAIGVNASRKVNSNSDYGLAGRSLRFPVLTGTLIGSFIGGAATMGNSGKAYEVGYAVLIPIFSFFIGYLALAYIAPRLRKVNIESLPDVLERRYGAKTRIVAAVILFATLSIIFVAQLIAFGVFTSTAFADQGITYTDAVLIGAIIVILYTIVGGLLAVAYTDLLQAVVMIIGIGVLLPFFYASDLGDWSDIGAALKPRSGDWLGGMDVDLLIALVPTYIAAVTIDATAWQRIAAARSAKDVQPALLTAGIVYLLWGALVVAMGVAAYSTYPNLDHGDQVIPMLLFNHMPIIVKGVCLAALLAIIMSTADTALLLCGTTVSTDLVATMRPQVKSETLLKISRGTILLVGVVGTFLALQRVPLFTINMLAVGTYVCGLFIPVMAALFVTRVSSAGAMASCLAGVLTVLLGSFLHFTTDIRLPIQPMLLGLMLSAATFFIVTHSRYSKTASTTPILDEA